MAIKQKKRILWITCCSLLSFIFSSTPIEQTEVFAQRKSQLLQENSRGTPGQKKIDDPLRGLYDVSYDIYPGSLVYRKISLNISVTPQVHAWYARETTDCKRTNINMEEHVWGKLDEIRELIIKSNFFHLSGIGYDPRAQHMSFETLTVSDRTLRKTKIIVVSENEEVKTNSDLGKLIQLLGEIRAKAREISDK